MLESIAHAIQRVQALSAYATYKERLTNTFGMVVEADNPRWTSGTDLLQTIRLVDESCPDGVALCIFGQQVDHMPRASPGDILELENVIVQFWQDRPQLFAKMSKPHCFGYRLYRVNGGSIQAGSSAPPPVQLYNTTADSRHAAERLPQLQALRLQALGHAAASDAACVYLRRIRDLAPPEEEGARPACVDMRVRVLAIDQRRASEEVILYVWDATDAKPVCASLQMLPSEWKGTQLQPAHPQRHVMPLLSEPPGLQVLQELPTMGTALPVVMHPAAVPTTGLPAVGDWVKVKVVGVAAVQGQWQVVFGKPSRLTQTQPSQAFESWHQTRLANQEHCEWPEDLSQVITRCSIPSLPSTTVRQVLLGAAQRQPGPFRVQLRLIGHLPQALQEWCKVRPQEDGGGREPQWEWAAHLWLEDATGELRALLLGQEGTKLLGIPPQCLSSSPAALQQLAARLKRLASVDEGGGVWVDAAVTPLYPALQQEQQQEHQQPEQQQEQEQEQVQPLEQLQQQQSQEQLSGRSPDQPAAEQQGGSQQQQLQLVPYVQQLEPATQERMQEQEQQQQRQVVPLSAPVQPVFVLHDAVFIEDSLQQQQQQQYGEGQGQQPGRQASPGQLVQGNDDRGQPEGPQGELLQLQQGSPAQEALEQQQEQQQITGQQQTASREHTPPGSTVGPAPPLQPGSVGSKRRREDGTGCAIG